jgi:outer membrane biosynthesis protein TonB
MATVAVSAVAEKKPNAYQTFINTKIAELKELSDNASLKYMELRKLANDEWTKLNPKKEPKAPKEANEPKATTEPKAPKEPKEPKAPKEPKEPKAPKEPKEPKAPKEPKEPKAPKEPKEPKAPKEPKEPKAEKVKRPLNAYQLFINAKVAEIKVLEENAGLKYMELRAIANNAWRVDHPVDPSKPPRKPREKKEKEPKEPKAEKVKRAPTAYNLFISAVLRDLKKEYEGAATKPIQTELMKLAAQKWNDFKVTESAVAV